MKAKWGREGRLKVVEAMKAKWGRLGRIDNVHSKSTHALASVQNM